MTTIYFIIGIPGSGKSYWLNQQNKEKSIIFDDISQMENPLIQLENAIKSEYNHIYIADVNFLEIKTLKNAEKIVEKFSGNKKTKFTYIIFKSDLEISKHNVKLRNDGRNVEQTIKRFYQSYDTVVDYLKDKETIILNTEKYKKRKKTI